MDQIDQAWRDASASWHVKTRRAEHHLAELQRAVTEFRERHPVVLASEPTAVSGRLAYRLKFEPIPADLAAIVGDVLHNLRSALDCVAFELARSSRGTTLTAAEEKAAAFPIRQTPESFEAFFTENKQRGTLFDPPSRAALRQVQPFRLADQASQVEVDRDTAATLAAYDELARLDTLWNIDKHRRLTVTAWRPDIIYWVTDAESRRTASPGDGTVEDGSILLYIDGSDEGHSDELSYEFNLVLTDDPAWQANPAVVAHDVVDLLRNWRLHIVDWVIPTIFTTLAQQRPAAQKEARL